jgi:exoribonuclease-2
MAGKPRLLLLVMSGDIWPVGIQDVQFAMPKSLVPADVASSCWSPALLQSWKDGTELEIDPLDPMFEARRKAVRILRKVMKETEKMQGRLLGGLGEGDRGGGIEAVWEEWSDVKERRTVTAAECAEWLLNSEEGEKKVHVRKNTLPAYAAHSLMMQRGDLFVADPGDMRETGQFLVRSQEERRRLMLVEGWYDGSIPGGEAITRGFTEKAKAAIAFSTSLDKNGEITERSHTLPEWTLEELEIIAVLLTRIYEVRATQISPTIAISQSIMKPINVYQGRQIDQDLVQQFLVDIGLISPHDSLERSRTDESNKRQMALQGVSVSNTQGSNDLLSGTELDDLREDFTSHKVFVIDDLTASELDDGIAIEKVHGSTDTWIHIHVADPTRYLHPNHPISTQASFQGSSVYLPDGNRPLLPLEIIMKELSLGAEVDRQGVMTFSALLGEDGQLKDEKVRMGWIRKPRVVTYAAANEALDLTSGKSATRPFGVPTAPKKSKLERTITEPTTEDITELKHLHELAINHRQRRYASAGFEYSLTQPSLHILSTLPPIPENIFDPSSISRSSRFYPGEPLVDYTVPVASTSSTLPSQGMVAECMILAGKVAASFCHKNNIPAPFRGTSAPKPINAPSSSQSSTILDHLLAKKDGLGAINPYEIIKSNLYLPPGEFSSTIIPHWIMGLTQPETGYLRATSPLRRYEDMLVHWQIKSHLASRKNIPVPWSKFNNSEIEILGKRNDIGQKANKRAGLNSIDWWATRLAASRLHGPLPEGYSATPDMIDMRGPMEAVVAGPSTGMVVDGLAPMPVRLEALAIPAWLYVPKMKELQVGEVVNVRITDVDTDKSIIKATLAD